MKHFRCRISVPVTFLLLMLALISCSSESEVQRRQLLESQPVLQTNSLQGLQPVEAKLRQNISRSRSVASSAIGDIAVSTSGDLILYDTQRQKVFMYPVNGPSEELSRIGSDPGEFRQLLAMSQCGQKLFILDGIGPQLDIISLDNASLNLSLSLHDIAGDHQLTDLQCLSEQRLLLRLEESLPNGERMIRFMLISDKARVLDQEVHAFRRSAMSKDASGEVTVVFDLPTDRTILSAVSSTNIYFNNGDQLLIPVYNDQGEYIKSLYYPFENLEVNRQDVIEEYRDAKMRRAMRGEDLPEDWPAADGMLTDDLDRIWISVIRKDHRFRSWIAIDPSGEPVQEILLPREAKVKAVLDDKLYILMYNPRTFRDEVRVYAPD